jgi:TonB family protein
MQIADQQARMTQDGIRLAYAVLISLGLHAFLLFEIQVGKVEQGGKPRHVIEARLAPSAAPDPSETLVKAIDGPVETQAQDVPLPEEAATPSPVQKTADAEAKPGMPEAAASPVLLDAPLPLDTTYYGLKEVDTPPSKLGDPMYPEQAAKLNISGKVRIRLLLNENGGVDEATVLSVDPPGWGFETAVLAFLKDGRFKPAMRKGRAVRSTVNYELEFSVDNLRAN